MQLIKETATHQIFEDFFKGQHVRFMKNKVTDEISLYLDDVAKVLGYEDEADFMSDDRILDSINEIHKDTGVFPLSTHDFSLNNKSEMTEVEDTPADELKRAISNNESILNAELLPVTVKSTVGRAVSYDKEFAVSFKASEGMDVVLTRDELEEILGILNDYKPA